MGDGKSLIRPHLGGWEEYYFESLMETTIKELGGRGVGLGGI